MNPTTILYIINLAIDIVNTLVEDQNSSSQTLWLEVQHHLMAISDVVDLMQHQIDVDEAAKTSTKPSPKV